MVRAFVFGNLEGFLVFSILYIFFSKIFSFAEVKRYRIAGRLFAAFLMVVINLIFWVFVFEPVFLSTNITDQIIFWTTSTYWWVAWILTIFIPASKILEGKEISDFLE